MTADVVFFPCWTWEEGLDDDVYYCIGERLKLEGETENMGVCTKERKSITAEVLMATPCTNSLGNESRGHRHVLFKRSAWACGRREEDGSV